MSTLTLVRHGQAHAFDRESDRLTEIGVRQSQVLGEYWKRHGIRFDRTICGTLKRHEQTAHAVASTGFALPAFERDPAWNEYPADLILQHLLPEIAARNDRISALHRAFLQAGAEDRNRHFQRLLEPLMLCWMNGEAHADVESAADFLARVRAAFRSIVEDSRSGQNVVVFTSGGAIGVCVQTILDAPPAAFLDLNWRIRNTSLTEITYSQGRVALDSWNSMAHLEERDLWTWR